MPHPSQSPDLCCFQALNAAHTERTPLIILARTDNNSGDLLCKTDQQLGRPALYHRAPSGAATGPWELPASPSACLPQAAMHGSEALDSCMRQCRHPRRLLPGKQGRLLGAFQRAWIGRPGWRGSGAGLASMSGEHGLQEELERLHRTGKHAVQLAVEVIATRTFRQYSTDHLVTTRRACSACHSAAWRVAAASPQFRRSRGGASAVHLPNVPHAAIDRWYSCLSLLPSYSEGLKAYKILETQSGARLVSSLGSWLRCYRSDLKRSPVSCSIRSRPDLSRLPLDRHLRLCAALPWHAALPCGAPRVPTIPQAHHAVLQA